MKLIVFSDIHGNDIALKEMIKKTKHLDITYYIHLGDIFGYFYNQKEVINILMENRVISIKGNHELIFDEINNDPSKLDFYVQKYGKSYLHNLSLLEHREKQFLSDIKENLEISYKQYNILFCHGSPIDPLNGRIYPDNSDFEMFKNLEHNVFFLGHTHYRLKVVKHSKLIMNPGSLGLPRDGNGYSYIFCDLDKEIFEFKKIKIGNKKIKKIINKYDDHNLYKNIMNIIKRGIKK